MGGLHKHRSKRKRVLASRECVTYHKEAPTDVESIGAERPVNAAPTGAILPSHRNTKVTHKRGTIYHDQAYAQGKMLESKAWAGRLASNITPSDIDFVVERYGFFILAEFSRHHTRLEELPHGQRNMYTNLINQGHIVGVCNHDTPLDEQISTCTSVRHATIYLEDANSYIGLDNDAWQRFVIHFTYRPQFVRNRLRERIAGNA